MGIMHVKMTIKGGRSATVSALVDTGASFTVIPRELADRIALPVFEGVRCTMADGRRVMMGRASALVTVRGRKVPATVLVTPNGGRVLLGAETLESLGLAVDPRKRRLKAIHSATVMAAALAPST